MNPNLVFNMVVYGNLLHRLGVKSISIYNIPIEQLQLCPP